jgi:mono/diheme cytochrome c family protein
MPFRTFLIATQIRRITANPLQMSACMLLAFFLWGESGKAEVAEVNGAPDKTAEVQFFRERIEPVLEAHCYACHSARDEMYEGNLQLDTRAGLLQGGDSGPALIPGDPEDSLVLQALRHEGREMPPDEPQLDGEIIESFTQWIRSGAVDPREGEPAVIERYDWREAREFWAFQPIQRSPIPEVQNIEWGRNWVDSFLLQQLEANGLAPAPAASPRELVRRLYFDLLGLPPTPEELEEFLEDTSEQSYERLVDRLLASPHFGERWGQAWLDVVRFAETEGFEYDGHLPGAWRYRDYVIRAFNDDKPFDQFTREQLAGDQLDQDRSAQDQSAGKQLVEDQSARDHEEGLAAAIFHRLGPVRRNAGNPEIALSRNEVLVERTDIIGSAFLGLTVGCARCHDHKLDPIPHTDYYQLQAFLAATAEANVELADGTTIPTIRDDPEQRTVIHLLRRGQEAAKGEVLAPRPPTVLIAPNVPTFPADDSRLRQHLAAWLTDPSHPLTPRVYVNRIWQHYFGRGLVGTPNDFGSHGERPSHPELLDRLADELLRHGWEAKRIHRLLVLSSAYRQSSRSPTESLGQQVDPENRWLWKKSRRRLSAEELRDAVLMASGLLQRDLGGPSVMIPVDQELIDLLYKPEQWDVHPEGRQHFRRSIYLISKRNLRLPFLEVFDQPSAQTSCGRREATAHAGQALELLNGSLTNEAARHFADRLRTADGSKHRSVPAGESGPSSEEQVTRDRVRRAFLLTCGRPPTDAEAVLAEEFLEQNPLEEFTLALLNFHGFLYVD